MKRIIAIILAAMLLLLCGCSDNQKYSAADVEKAADNFFDIEHTVSKEKVRDFEDITEIHINGYNYDVSFEDVFIYVFDSKKDAVTFLEKHKNEEYSGIDSLDNGDNYCHAFDHNAVTDIMCEIHLYQDNNVVFCASEFFGTSFSKAEEEAREKNFYSFIENDIPKFFDTLD